MILGLISSLLFLFYNSIKSTIFKNNTKAIILGILTVQFLLIGINYGRDNLSFSIVFWGFQTLLVMCFITINENINIKEKDLKPLKKQPLILNT